MALDAGLALPPSPFRDPAAVPLAPEKFRDPLLTAKGEPRASVTLGALSTLWFNTGTRCNLACTTCYIESSPTNDSLAYLTLAEVARFLDELSDPIEIGFTGGEPFINPEIVAMLGNALERRHRVLVLSNAMRPMRRHEQAILALAAQFHGQLTIRVSLDHFTARVHELERGARSWERAISGLSWLAANNVPVAVAGRLIPGESEKDSRGGYQALFSALEIAIDASDPAALVLFPEMDAAADVAEISEQCWEVLEISPTSPMCASSRMIVHRKTQAAAEVAACTLIPFDEQFLLGSSLGEARRSIALNHPHCARFCVLGGARCSG